MFLAKWEFMLDGSYNIDDPSSMAQATKEANDNLSEAELEISEIVNNRVETPTLKVEHETGEFTSLYVLGENDYYQDGSSRRGTKYYGPKIIMIEETHSGRRLSEESINSKRIWDWIQRISQKGIEAFLKQNEING